MSERGGSLKPCANIKHILNKMGVEWFTISCFLALKLHVGLLDLLKYKIFVVDDIVVIVAVLVVLVVVVVVAVLVVAVVRAAGSEEAAQTAGVVMASRPSPTTCVDRWLESAWLN